jgi:hypothetical protein
VIAKYLISSLMIFAAFGSHSCKHHSADNEASGAKNSDQFSGEAGSNFAESSSGDMCIGESPDGELILPDSNMADTDDCGSDTQPGLNLAAPKLWLKITGYILRFSDDVSVLTYRSVSGDLKAYETASAAIEKIFTKASNKGKVINLAGSLKLPANMAFDESLHLYSAIIVKVAGKQAFSRKAAAGAFDVAMLERVLTKLSTVFPLSKGGIPLEHLNDIAKSIKGVGTGFTESLINLAGTEESSVKVALKFMSELGEKVTSGQIGHELQSLGGFYSSSQKKLKIFDNFNQMFPKFLEVPMELTVDFSNKPGVKEGAKIISEGGNRLSEGGEIYKVWMKLKPANYDVVANHLKSVLKTSQGMSDRLNYYLRTWAEHPTEILEIPPGGLAEFVTLMKSTL